MKKFTLAIALSAALISTIYAGNKAIAPEKTHGLSPVVVHQNSLEAQITSMKGYDLRGRKITLEPGAATTEHSHSERPGIVYVIEGKVIEYRNGVKNAYQSGDTWIETAETVHWVQNKSDKKAVIFMVDLPKQE